MKEQKTLSVTVSITDTGTVSVTSDIENMGAIALLSEAIGRLALDAKKAEGTTQDAEQEEE